MASDEMQKVSSGRTRWGNWVLVLLILAGAVGIAYAWLGLPAEYVAIGLVYVDTALTPGPFELKADHLSLEVMNRLVADVAEGLRQDRVFDAAFKDDAVRATTWYQEGIRRASWSGELVGTERLYEKLKDHLEVSIVPDTSYLQVRFRAWKRGDAEVIVQTVMDEYLVRRKDEAVTGLNLRLTECQRSLKELADKLERIRDERAKYRSTWPLGESSGSAGPTAGWYVEFGQQVARQEIAVLQTKARWEALKSEVPELLSLSSPEDVPLIRQDPQIALLEQLALSLELGLDRNGSSESQPATQPADTRIRTIEAKLATLKSQRQAELRSGRLIAAETAYLDSLSIWLSLSDRMMELKNERRDQDSRMVRDEAMQQEQQMLEAQYAKLSAHMQDLQMVISSNSTVRVHAAGSAVGEIDHTTAIGLTTFSVVVPLGFAVLLGLTRLLMWIRRGRRPQSTFEDGDGDRATAPEVMESE